MNSPKFLPTFIYNFEKKKENAGLSIQLLQSQDRKKHSLIIIT